MILYINHFDSFCNIIIDYLKQLDKKIVLKNTHYFKDLNKINLAKYSHVLIGPGPGHPKELLFLYPFIRKIIYYNIPLLGICLGHQLLAQYFGAKIVQSQKIMHGESSVIICNTSNKLYKNIAEKHSVIRYHSLIVDNESVPLDLNIVAYTTDNEIMAFSHCKLSIYGIQYHPEAYLSNFGLELLKNFVMMKK